MNIYDYREVIENFGAKQALRYFNQVLDGYLEQPYKELTYDQQRKFEGFDRVRKAQLKKKGVDFHFQYETNYIVCVYAYGGAIDMRDPISPKSREEITVSFIDAYCELRERRNRYERQLRQAKKEDRISVISLDPSIMESWLKANAPEYKTSYELDPYDDSHSNQILRTINKLSPTQLKVFNAKAANPGKSDAEIADMLGMDRAHFHRTMKRIENVFSDYLKP